MVAKEGVEGLFQVVFSFRKKDILIILIGVLTVALG